MQLHDLYQNTEKESVILLVDDHPDNLQVLSDFLSVYGFEILVARDGQSGLDKAQYAQPDLILLDVHLPDIDGFEVCRQLKANPDTHDIPVIFVTAYAAETSQKVKGFAVGAVDYLTKPFQEQELLARVTTHIQLRALTRSLQAQTVVLQQEVAERIRAEVELKTYQEQLEHLVAARTTELARANQHLIQEIVERKQIEERLRQSEERLSLALDAASDGLFDWNLLAGKVYFSPRWYTMLEYTPGELPASYDTWKSLLHPDDVAATEQAVQDYLRDKSTTLEQEYRLRTRSGVWKWVLSRAKIVERDANGVPVRVAGTHVDITERKRVEEELRASQKLLHAVISNAPVTLYATDQDGQLTLFEGKGMEVLGFQPGHQVGISAFDLYQRKPEAIGYLRHALQGQEQRESITVGDVIFDAWHTPLRDQQGQITGAIGVVTDITERKRAEEAIRWMNADLERRVATRTAELEAKSRELEAFAYSVSHDLKAPLRGIAGYSRLLLDEHAAQLDDEGQAFLQTICRATDHMNQLIDDLLAYARLERLAPSLGSVDLTTLVQTVLNERADQIDARHIAVLVDLPCTAVLANRDGLTLALRNLLDNAIKFTSGVSDPTIRIGSMATSAGCRIWVGDNGIGFDMRYHSRIFDIFQRLHRAEDYSGTGIGLAIVRKAIERLGGLVWAESKPGAGATFYLEIPNEDSTSQPAYLADRG